MKLIKVKAGALQLTMFIVVVIALLLTAFIILIHTHKQFKIKTNFVIEAVTNAQKGIVYALHNDLLTTDTTSLRLEGTSYKTLTVHKSYWGIFEKIIATSKIKHNVIKKMALVGTHQSAHDRPALYVEEHHKPLVVVGNTTIRGLAYVPEQGVRTGHISGHAYYGTQLIYGSSKTSQSSLPELEKTSEHHLKYTYNIDNLQQDQFLDLSKTRIYQNSFYKPVQVVYSHSYVNLSGVSLTGHIIVQSNTKIIVDASSQLKDVILVAPEIEIKTGVNGTFQTIATKRISVGKNVILNYPSALILNKKKATKALANQEKKEQCISINSGTKIKGIVTCLGVIDANNYESQIKIASQAEIMGEVYCTQNLELLGTVYGSVYTANFVAKQSGSSYQNHIYNGTIIADQLPEEYIGLPFKQSKKGVAKWLY